MISLVLAVILATSVTSTPMTYTPVEKVSVQSQWEKYRTLKESVAKAEASGNTTIAVAYSEKKIAVCKVLGRRDLEAWTLNNLGYCFIKAYIKSGDITMVQSAEAYLKEAEVACGDSLTDILQVVKKNLDFCSSHLK